jgi:molybdopterin converting factor small subunit
MEVEIRLFAGLRKGRFKKRRVDLPQGCRLRKVLDDLAIEEEDVSLPLVNGQFSDMGRELKPGDVLAVFPAVGGG